MKSKKAIWDFRVGIKTYKNFKFPKESQKYYRLTYSAPKIPKMIQKHNTKRSRHLDWFEVLGFEWEDNQKFDKRLRMV